jgi:prefoldin subunit 5
MLENLNPLIEAANKEISDIQTALDTLSDSSNALVAANQAVADAQVAADEAQAATDAARLAVANEKSQAIEALRAIIAEVQTQIAALQA